MPIPAHLQKALSYTSSGIPFQLLLDGFTRQALSDANQIEIRALVGGEDLDQFEIDAVGYASWDGSATNLQRTLPIQCELKPSLWCQSVQVIKWGGVNEDGETAYAEPTADNWPLNVPWVMVKLTFTRPKWWVRNDETLKNSYSGKEQFRFAEISRRYIPRELRQPGQFFEVNTKPDGSGTWKQVEVASFVPVYDTEITVRLIEWPVSAFNEVLAADLAGCVNSTTFAVGDGWTYQAGRVMYSGLQQPSSWFQNAADEFCVSPMLTFKVRQGGWNYQLLPDRDGSGNLQYGPVRYSKVTPNTAPYPTAELQALFQPVSPS